MIVCGGTYKVQAVVTKSLALVGRHGATINARGQKPISKKLPGAAAWSFSAPGTSRSPGSP